jgi:hypothetical protein
MSEPRCAVISSSHWVAQVILTSHAAFHRHFCKRLLIGYCSAVVRVTAVENWPRAFTKPMREDLSKVAAGAYEFSEHEHLLWAERTPSDGQTNGGDDDDIGASDKTPADNE